MDQGEMLSHIVEPLAEAVTQTISDLRDKGELVPEQEPYYSWKVEEFEYTEKGVTKCRRRSELTLKESWLKSSIAVSSRVNELAVFAGAVKLLAGIMNDQDEAAQAVANLASELIRMCLRDTEIADETLEHLADIFLKDISGEPVINSARVDLDGLVILAEKLEFSIADTHVVLRPVQKEDLEYEARAMTPVPMRTAFPETPTAILELQFLGREMGAIQRKVEQAIAVLRLFKTGSVKYISFQTRADSVVAQWTGGMLLAGPFERALDKATIVKDDAPVLKQFWSVMLHTLPPDLHDLSSARLDYMTIAYRRYCDALLTNGAVERRIANAVMSLESIFLKAGETQELLYRLSIRVARVFGVMGFDPHLVKRSVQDAYTIRSLFVHGAHLSHKKKQKLAAKHGDTRSFLLALLDYCRMSILSALLMKKDKDEYVDLIDDALVDTEGAKRLQQLLQNQRHLIVPSHIE